MSASTCIYIKRWTHGLSKHYQFREWCIKPNQILMSWSLLCMCCKEQLPLLFIIQKNNVWSYISVEDLGQIVCDGLHVLGFALYVFIYAIYIYSTNRFDGHGKEKVLKPPLENGPLCHAMALERTLIRVLMLWSRHWSNNLCHLYSSTQCISTNVVCSASTGITELPHVTISPFYVRRVYYQGVMESVIDARGGVIYATGSLGDVPLEPKNQTHPSTCTYTK